MNRPPPVIFPVGIRTASRSRLGRMNLGGAIAGIWILAIMPVLAALALHPSARAHVAAWGGALAASIPGAWLAWRFWRGQVPGKAPSALIWNGAEWLLEEGVKGVTAAAIVPPSIRFDGQCWMLLRTHTGRRAVWLWAARSADPARWHGLRCALYASAATPVAMA